MSPESCVEVYRPVESIDQDVVDHLVVTLEKEGVNLRGVRWQPETKAPVVRRAELSSVLAFAGVRLDESTAKALSDEISSRLPKGADREFKYPQPALAIRTRQRRYRPNRVALTLGAMHTTLRMERAAVKRYIESKYNVPVSSELWLPPPLLEIHLAHGHIDRIAPLLEALKNHKSLLPAGVVLGRSVVADTYELEDF